MSKTNTFSVLRFASTACFVASIITFVSTSQQASHALELAQLTDQGSVLLIESTSDSESVPTLKLVPIHSAAPSMQSERDIAHQLIIGLLLFVAGFGFHALLIIRNERSVRVTAIRSTVKDKRKPKILTMYWMEVIRRK